MAGSGRKGWPSAQEIPPLRLAAPAAALLIPLGARHLWLWGGALGPALNLLETLAVAAAILLLARQARRAELLADPRGLLLLGLLFVLVPPFLSEDVRDYLVRGRLLAVYGANPYAALAKEFPADPYVAAGVPAWSHFPSPYGPLAAELQGLVALAAEGVRRLAGTWASVVFGIGLFKLLGLLCLLGTAAAAARAGRGALAVAASPLMLVELVGMAHNDAWMILPAVWALVLAREGRAAPAGALLVAAALFKPPAAILWPLLAAACLRAGRLRPLLLGSALAALAGGLHAWARFFRDPALLGAFGRQAGITRASLRLFLGEGLEAAGLSHADAAARLGLQVLFGLIFLWCVYQAWRRPAGLAGGAAGLMLAAAFLPLGLTNPWYLAWALPFARLAGGQRWRSFAAAADVAGPLSYSWYLATRTLGRTHQACQLGWLGLAAIWAISPRRTRGAGPGR